MIWLFHDYVIVGMHRLVVVETSSACKCVTNIISKCEGVFAYSTVYSGSVTWRFTFQKKDLAVKTLQHLKRCGYKELFDHVD